MGQGRFHGGRGLGRDVLPRPAAALTRPRLEGDDHVAEIVRFLERAGYRRVVVHPENFWIRHRGHRVDVVEVRLERGVRVGCDGGVSAAPGELVVVGQDLRRQEIGDDDVGGAHVLVVRHPAPVVHHRSQLPEDLVRHVVVLVDVELELGDADIEVRLVEVVRHVPAQRAKLLALDDERVEEAEAEEELAVRFRLVGPIQFLVAHLDKGGPEVGPEAAGRLLGHLHRRLKDAHRKVRRRNGSQPEAERLVHLVRLQGLAQPFQRGEPGDAQVTVLQQDPAAVGRRLFDELGGDGALALAQRDAL
mmetsp:Transcript_25181/g.84581  ORF Transcript_25181/g.84581 Transcript_25181/m.84581 type:complete len:304 (-) Transcript_25181:4079-4990(-)